MTAEVLGNLALGVLGIVVSLVLFFVGYRQTIGARKERIMAANGAVERVLIRRVVHENYAPNLADVSRLLEGKAQDFRVRIDSLFDEAQVLTAVFTRIMETEFIAQQQRDEVLLRLEKAILDAESGPPPEVIVAESRDERRERIERASFATVLAVLASLAGGVVSLLPNIGELADRINDLAPVVIGTMALSLGTIGGWLVVLRFRESTPELQSRAGAQQDALRFEREMFEAIDAAGVTPEFSSDQDRGFDFVLPIAGRRLLVELKAWMSPPPARVLAIVSERLAEAVRANQGDEGVIVVGGAMPRSVALPDQVRMVSAREFKRELRRAA